MSKLIESLVKAQKYAMSNRPKSGGFPFLAESLRQAGVKMNRWSLPSCQSIYIMNGGSIVQQGPALITGTHEIPAFDRKNLIAAIRADQEGHTSFAEFLMAAWNAGVIAYDVDFINRTVSYYGINDESYIEEYLLPDLVQCP